MARKSKRETEPETGSQSVRLFGDRTNRTGLLAQSLAREMEDNTAFTPRGRDEEFAEFRGALLHDAEPLGTMPRPASIGSAAKQAAQTIQGQRPLVLLDRLAARLAFERTGTRIYETLLAKLDRDGSFDGGPNPQHLMEIRDEELEHFHTLAKTIERMGGDPTAVTPCADIGAVASMGVLQVIADPRIRFDEALGALLVAELVDLDEWILVYALAEESGDEDLQAFALRAQDEENRHLDLVRSWVKARTLDSNESRR